MIRPHPVCVNGVGDRTAGPHDSFQLRANAQVPLDPAARRLAAVERVAVQGMSEPVARRSVAFGTSLKGRGPYQVVPARDAIKEPFNRFRVGVHGRRNQDRRKPDTNHARDLERCALAGAQPLDLGFDHLRESSGNADVAFRQLYPQPNGGAASASDDTLPNHVVQRRDHEQGIPLAAPIDEARESLGRRRRCGLMEQVSDDVCLGEWFQCDFVTELTCQKILFQAIKRMVRGPGATGADEDQL